jgi:hypothetical protein
MRRVLHLVGVTLLVAGAPFLGAAQESPEAIVSEIYGYYTNSNTIGIRPSDPELRPYFVDELTGLLEADDELAGREGLGRLGFDPFVDAQDFAIEDLDISGSGATGDRATVEARFTNFGQPTRIVYSFVRDDGAWLIEEIEAPDGPYPWRLSDLLEGE